MIRYEMPMEVVAGCPVCGPDREATPTRNRLLCSAVTGGAGTVATADVSATETERPQLLTYDPAWAKLGNDWEMREADLRIQAELADWLPQRIFDASPIQRYPVPGPELPEPALTRRWRACAFFLFRRICTCGTLTTGISPRRLRTASSVTTVPYLHTRSEWKPCSRSVK